MTWTVAAFQDDDLPYRMVFDSTGRVVATISTPEDARLIASSPPMLRQLEYIAEEMQRILDIGGVQKYLPILAEEIEVYLKTTRRVIAEAKGQPYP